jgi:hypothetical protein
MKATSVTVRLRISSYRLRSTNTIEIKSDEQLFRWFELNQECRVVRIDAQINDFEGPLQFSPTKHRCHPAVRNKVLQTHILLLCQELHY